MALSAAVSVASFSVVLAESFAAVAVSTLVPATFLAVARAAKGAAANATAADGFVGQLPGVGQAVEALKSAAKNINDIDLLVPKTAKIHGEFEFQGGEAIQAGASLGGQVQVVSVSAGYSALYQSSSKNKITLDVDFAAVNYTL